MKYGSVLYFREAALWEPFALMDPDLNHYLHPVPQ